MNPTKNNYPTIAVLYLFLSIAITLLMAQTPFSKSAQAAPPTNYEGFGSVTRGALDAPEGYEIYHVTKLDDDGSFGTLRDAVSQGSRYIVFDVGGTITLETSLAMHRSYLTIDGSSAPYPGITIDQATYDTETYIDPPSPGVHDIIINNLRFVGPGAASGKDILRIRGAYGPVSNIIIDHCTATAAGDGVFDTTGQVTNVTQSWNLIMETELVTIVSYGGIGEISFHHNVYAKNAERQVSFDYAVQLGDYVNNVVYGWDYTGGLRIYHKEGEINPNVNVENNVFHIWKNGFYDRPTDAFVFFRGPDEGDVYINGNIAPVECTAVQDGAGSVLERLPVPAYAQVTMYPASTLGDTVVPFAGTHYPTPEEQDLLNEISIAIGGQAAPIANAGPNQTITDKDKDGSEQVTLDGSASRDPDGTIVSFIWSEESSQIATGINPTVTLSTGTHLITLTVTDNGGSTDTNTVTIKVLEGDKEFAELPAGCYNNVFNPAKGERALIVVELAEQAHVKLGLYNIRGNKIKELADEEKEAGTHKYYWDGKSGNGDVVGSGLYFVHIQAGDYKKTKKIVVVK